MTSRIAIIAKYKEDTSWIGDLSPLWEIALYSKNPEETDKTATPLPNIGHEAHTYLHYIVAHYDSLPDEMTFLQGGALDHAPQLLIQLSNPDILPDYIELSTHAIVFNDLARPHLINPITNNGLDFRSFYKFLYQEPCPKLFCCRANALFFVRKSKILRRPKTFYENALNLFTSQSEKHVIEAHFFERLWHRTFDESTFTRSLERLRLPSGDSSEINSLLIHSMTLSAHGKHEEAHQVLVRINDIVERTHAPVKRGSPVMGS